MLYYRLIRPFARIAIRTFYKKIYLTGRENIPTDKPVIFALNHPTAFVEPCILATTLDTELHFLVRGDFFRKSLHNNLLRGFGCLPVFRMKDGGYENIKNNFETFQVTYQTLGRGEPIVILAEGTTVHEKRLRPLKKGTARLAFGTTETQGAEIDVHIVPVGVNYTYADQFRSEVMIDMGKPIRARDFWATYQENNAKGIKELTDELRSRLEERIVIIEEETDEDFVEKQLVLSRNGKPQPVLPVLSKKGSRLKAEKRISEAINKMPAAEKAERKAATNAYFFQLKKLNISDLGLVNVGDFGLGAYLHLLFGLIPFCIGYLVNFPPAFLTGYIGREKIKDIEFRAPVMITVSIAAFLLWYLFLFLLAPFVGGPSLVIKVIILLLSPPLGYFALLYREYFLRFKAAKKAGKTDAAVREELLQKRRKILV